MLHIKQINPDATGILVSLFFTMVLFIIDMSCLIVSVPMLDELSINALIGFMVDFADVLL